jgi:hypothetical protein
MPPNIVYVGRPSVWGNPFTGKDAAERYREAVAESPVPEHILKDWEKAGGDKLMLKMLAFHYRPLLDKLRGKNLACWCKEGEPCHADILLEIVNEIERNYL